ncbi:TetR/AcrR family transcriptional regulator [Bacilli bacterium]|uniref:TetR/AcrR family transcriptional regulator n=1 Tax=Oceanobacillus sp. FSL K6-0118 TaxID=2921418 RepID=UPI0006218EDE|nr:TetR family transcriptional regulator [Bacilli bacterium VT-13-104]PZD83820.1 TetR/AcrR family transcriptional regulator [Bacilli bacterium]PZD86523.1 TetR/AcrR family transcriptional regulator [Bacilli bacterium]PZD90042.1 TetR/AcrR family transcriptional regulator [Bacilli bacterium]RCO05467.1 TetR/AcrR family transcriptional regulator [Bacilli bacterium]
MAARKAVAKELTRDMIMDAARDLFVEKGYQQVSMRQIAKKLNYSHGAIYYHFKNKAELFYALVKNHFLMLDQKIEEIVNDEASNEEKLGQLFFGYIEFGLTHQNHYEIMFLTKDDEVRNFINESPMVTYQKFANQVSKLSEKQMTIREIWSIFISLHGFVTHYLGHITTFDEVKSAARFHVNMLLRWTKK